MSGSVYLTVLWLVINETEPITYHKAQLRQQKNHPYTLLQAMYVQFCIGQHLLEVIAFLRPSHTHTLKCDSAINIYCSFSLGT